MWVKILALALLALIAPKYARGELLKNNNIPAKE